MAAEYYVRIKKEYAAAIIEDLEKMDAIEIFEPSADEGDVQIPQWQQEEVRRRIVARRSDPSLLLGREEAEAAIKEMGK